MLNEKSVMRRGLPKSVKNRVLAKFPNCYWCGKSLVRAKDASGIQNHDTATVDHIVPLRRGGKSNDDNLVGACYGCNQRRAAFRITLGEIVNARNGG